MEMNRIHKKAAEFRQQYYNYKDDYDYTHGGLYDIYTNYDDSEESYDENGHYEHVYRFDVKTLNEFFDIATEFIPTEDEEETKEAIEEVSEDLINQIAKKLAKVTDVPSLPGYVQIALFACGVVKDAYDDLKEFEADSLKSAESFGENVSKKHINDNVDIYIYLLNGGYSTEIKVRAVDKKTRKTLSEDSFDLRQYESYDSCIDSANVYGDLVSVNRRHWKYSYVSQEI